MAIDSLNYLGKQKRKLTLIFSVVIFLIILLFEISFLTFKYIDTKNQELARLKVPLNIISKDIQWNMMNRMSEFSGIKKNWNRWNNFIKRLKQDIVVYDNLKNQIIFSSLPDEMQSMEFIDLMRKSNRNSIEYLQEHYYFVKSINKNIEIYSFSEDNFNFTQALKEFFNYALLWLIFSAGLYFLWYKFISYILNPVEENIKDMEQFIYNAWHELKTPIAVAKSSLQLSKETKNYSESIDESISELNKMNQLIDSLINLSTISYKESTDTFKVNDLVNDILKLYKPQIENRNLSIVFNELTVLTLTSNYEYFKIMISNIISNAIKYNKDGWTITITLDKSYIKIQDTGIWILQENQQNVFDRFYQVKESRNQDWFGIWLSLVKKIVDIYWWKLKLESTPDIWTTITILF